MKTKTTKFEMNNIKVDTSHLAFYLNSIIYNNFTKNSIPEVIEFKFKEYNNKQIHIEIIYSYTTVDDVEGEITEDFMIQNIYNFEEIHTDFIDAFYNLTRKIDEFNKI